ncbi:MAG: helix-turn-helix transcriptional regulator, partial [Clostridiaceae bacterium]|nr:helix-turn-helix transcriptional regulator [Clostridiaceae bacterium]
MYFNQKLKGLMQLFKISNSKLARGINVDASLVSRWKSGERAMSPSSPHVPAIASFFLGLNAYHYQQEFLDYILKHQLPDDMIQDEGRRIHALADWLVSDEPFNLDAALHEPQSPAHTQNIIANIAGLMNTDSLPKLPDISNQAAGITRISHNPGVQASFEKFDGIEGKRQAVLNFLIEVVKSDRKQDLLLHSEDDMTWLTGDRQYTLIWASLLKQIIESGHSITIIHVVDRQREEIMNALTYWMPLHLAGQIDSFYFPRYVESPVKRTLFIARGQSAIAAWNVSDSKKLTTFFYRDLDAISTFESMYEAHLSQCRRLFSVFSRQNGMQLIESGYDLRQKSGTVFNMRSQLNSLLLPKACLTKTLEDNLINPNKQQMIKVMLEHQELFFRKLRDEDYYDIIPVAILDQLERFGRAEVDSCLLCLTEPWIMDSESTIIWIEETIHALKKYEHYHLYLSDQTPGLEDINVNIIYKENNGALFSPSTS